MALRLAGVALFLPVPLVLWLFTAAPLGVAASLALGVAVMVSHRLYARPFALAHARRRCLWCGRDRAEGPEVPVTEPLGPTTWRACSNGHASALDRTLAGAQRTAPWLRLGILGTLGLFLPAAALAQSGLLGPVGFDHAAAAFKLGIAATVVPYGWLAPRGRGGLDPAAHLPFPLHIQALVGTIAVLWLFRVVGAVWVVQLLRLAAQAWR